MLQELADKGYPVDFDALDAPFNLTISSIASIDVDDCPIIKLSQRVREIVRESGFECELADIVIFPMVLNPEIPSAADKVTWRRASRSYSVRKHIDFSEWQRAKPNAKKEMLARCIIESIESIPTKHLSQSNKDALVAIVRQAMHSRRAPRTAKEAD